MHIVSWDHLKKKEKGSAAQQQSLETLDNFFTSSDKELLAEYFLKGIVHGLYCFILFCVNFCGIVHLSALSPYFL